MLLQCICRARVWLLLSLGLPACGKRDQAPAPPLHQSYVRGDRVVVEQAAAQFFEGRVLAVTGDQLRLQAAGDNDSVNVAASDVYRLPPEPRELSAGALAICGRAAAWSPCRIQKLNGKAVSAGTANGEAFELQRDHLLLPSPLTELNLKRYFERSEAQLSFERDAQQAGEPRPDANWHPSLRERLLVKSGPDWFTGYVRELGDDTVTVALNAGRRTVTVPVSALAPEPPTSVVADLRRGDFVLFRPEAASEPWARWQIRAVNDAEIKLIDAGGVSKSASVRDVVLLRP
ncbi:MAG TPA: hypothetical protein VIK01_06485 [Polyangiaceae bacterium]